jgi:carboxypeptidase C (cathepsin A)
VNGDFDSDWGRDYSHLLPVLLEAGIRVLVYAGDADYDYNWLGNKAWAKAMKWKHQDSFAKAKDRSWRDSYTSQTVGEVRSADALTFVRIYGAGLLVCVARLLILYMLQLIRGVCVDVDGQAQGDTSHAQNVAWQRKV